MCAFFFYLFGFFFVVVVVVFGISFICFAVTNSKSIVNPLVCDFPHLLTSFQLMVGFLTDRGGGLLTTGTLLEPRMKHGSLSKQHRPSDTSEAHTKSEQHNHVRLTHAPELLNTVPQNQFFFFLSFFQKVSFSLLILRLGLGLGLIHSIN